MKRPLFRIFPLLTATALLTGAAGAMDEEPARYRVESAVWCSGELRGQPELLVAPGRSQQFEIDAPDTRWRLSVDVEPSEEAEGALPGAVWLKVDIEQYVEGQWQFISDTMVGTPLGEPGRITVVEQGAAESDPASAPLYVELTTTRVEPENGG